MTFEEIARVAHEVNRSYCRAIGDDSQLAWEYAPEWQRASAINGVKFIAETPDASPSASHDSWLAEKQADGWRYGPIKDPERKEHPCFVPYDELPTEQKAKDYIFGAVARSLLSAVPKRPHGEVPDHIEQFFAWTHLPAHLAAVSAPFGSLAGQIVATLPRNPERTVALRKLLEAKDAAVRAAIAK